MVRLPQNGTIDFDPQPNVAANPAAVACLCGIVAASGVEARPDEVNHRHGHAVLAAD